MALTYTSQKLSLNNAEKFKASFSDATNGAIEYIFIGDHVPYVNESSPPQIVETIASEKTVWDNIFAAKRATANDVELVIPKVNWTSNTNYRQYDDTIELDQLITANVSQNLKPFYVITTDRNVYKCLSNNASANSTIEPTGDYTTSNGVIATADGYIWKYMYNVRPSNKFLTNDWIPIATRSDAATTLTDYNLDSTGVVDGELSTVVVTDQGSNYYHSVVTVTSFTTGCSILTLANTINLAANMSVTGTGVPTDAFISILDTPNNRITLSSSAIANGGGTGNNLTITTRVYFEGDGSNAAASVTLANDSISKVTLSTIGTGYSFANVFIYGSGTGANGRCIIAPKYGHAFNPVKDLLGKNVMVTSKIGDIDSTESGLISVDTSFRQYGLLRNPHKYGQSVRANNTTANSVISQAKPLTIVPGTAYNLDEYVYQGTSANNATAYGYVYSQTINGVRLTKVQGTFSVGLALIGANSGISRTVVAVSNPEFEPYSGDILYVENATKTDREDGQAENIRFVIQF
jgi:hypothetical protein